MIGQIKGTTAWCCGSEKKAKFRKTEWLVMNSWTGNRKYVQLIDAINIWVNLLTEYLLGFDMHPKLKGARRSYGVTGVGVRVLEWRLWYVTQWRDCQGHHGAYSYSLLINFTVDTVWHVVAPLIRPCTHCYENVWMRHCTCGHYNVWMLLAKQIKSEFPGSFFLHHHGAVLRGHRDSW